MASETPGADRGLGKLIFPQPGWPVNCAVNFAMARLPYGYEIDFSWVKLRRDSSDLAEFLHQKGHWQGIVAVTRGGLARAALAARELLSKAFFATLYAKPAGRPVIDMCIKEFKQKKWIEFPWAIDYRFATPIKERGRVTSGP